MEKRREERRGRKKGKKGKKSGLKEKKKEEKRKKRGKKSLKLLFRKIREENGVKSVGGGGIIFDKICTPDYYTIY